MYGAVQKSHSFIPIQEQQQQQQKLSSIYPLFLQPNPLESILEINMSKQQEQEILSKSFFSKQTYLSS